MEQPRTWNSYNRAPNANTNGDFHLVFHGHPNRSDMLSRIGLRDISRNHSEPCNGTYNYRQKYQTNERLRNVVSLGGFFNGSDHCIGLERGRGVFGVDHSQ